MITGRRTGAWASDAGTVLTLEECTVTAAENTSIRATGGGRVVLRGSTLADFENDGVLVRERGSVAELTGCTIRSDGGHAVTVQSHGTGAHRLHGTPRRGGGVRPRRADGVRPDRVNWSTASRPASRASGHPPPRWPTPAPAPRRRACSAGSITT